MTECYRWPRSHTVELNGGRVEFSSYVKDEFYLESEAISAAIQAGLFVKQGDAYKILLDGKPIRHEFK